MNDLVSVVIPAYNAENTIIECLKSVKEQTYTNLEVIVINDGSKDNTAGILETYKKENKDFPLIIYTIKNSGPATARNIGIKHSRGKYIAFLDSDDKWLPTKIEKQIYYLEKYPEINLLGCDYTIGKSSRTDKDGIMFISKRQLLFKNPFPTPCVILRKQIIQDNLYFSEGKKFSEDYFLWLNIAFNNHKCAKLHEKLTILDDKPTYGHKGLSSRLWDMEKGELSNYKYVYDNSKISLGLFSRAAIFSLLKFCKRIILTHIRKFIK